jgi:WD40 repeat protein
VTIDRNTAEVTPICGFDETGSSPNIGFNPEDGFLYYAQGSDLFRITDIPTCEIVNLEDFGAEGLGPLGFIYGFFTNVLIPSFIPQAEASHTTSFRAITWWPAGGVFLVGSFDTIRTYDLETLVEEIINSDMGHDTKGFAFNLVGQKSGGGDDDEPPTIGMNRAGDRLLVTCGVAFDADCFTITSDYHEEFKLYEMMSGTHTVSITVYCAKGVNYCNYVGLGIMPYSEFNTNPTWWLEATKNLSGQWTVSKTDPLGYTGEVIVTTQIVNNKFVIVSFTIQFNNIDTGPMKVGIQARSIDKAVRNWYLNEGVEIKDAHAYPYVETAFEKPLKVDSLCLNENSNKRYTCAFKMVQEWATQNAEETLNEILSGNYVYDDYYREHNLD